MRFLIQHALDVSAESRPEKPLFRFEEQTLTYAQVVARSNALAHLLVDLGVRRGDRVGIYLRKSTDTGVALYGILKAGAAYVPIDPALPAARVEMIIRDCDVRHLVTETGLLPQLEKTTLSGQDLTAVIGPPAAADGDSGLRVIPWSDLFQMPADRPPSIPGLTEEDLAYIMYTSGSTGTPKGLMHTHRSGLSYATMAAHVYGVTTDDVLSNHSPLHFDMSTFDYFAGPLCGATTVVIPEPYMKLPASLSELIQDERITIWYSVTTALVQLLLRGDLDNRDLSALRWVKFGGEVFPPRHLRNLMEKLPRARFSNVYGPAEVNQCTYFHVPSLPNKYHDIYVPIGRPWPIADALVVDENDEEAAGGEAGELLIAAPTRMQGYWKQPELTERGFYRRKPFAGSPYEKTYYRTGDIVRLDEDGELAFLGRKDRQVKVRGFRVELDEVEAALTSHADVAEAAVFLQDDAEEKQIAAAVRLRHERRAAVGSAELLRHVERTLPVYAVPARLVIRDAFPRTGSGKIDRRALQKLTATGG